MIKYLFIAIFTVGFMCAQSPPRIPENFSSKMSVISYREGFPPDTHEYSILQDKIERRIRYDLKSYDKEESQFLFFEKNRDVVVRNFFQH